MQRFTNLLAWQHAHQFTLQVYLETRSLPHDELYGLRAQLRRASVSICANIAEGSKRDSDTEFARYLNIAQASAAECEALIMLCRDLAYVNENVARNLLANSARVSRLLHGLREACRAPKRDGKAGEQDAQLP